MTDVITCIIMLRLEILFFIYHPKKWTTDDGFNPLWQYVVVKNQLTFGRNNNRQLLLKNKEVTRDNINRLVIQRGKQQHAIVTKRLRQAGARIYCRLAITAAVSRRARGSEFLDIVVPVNQKLCHEITQIGFLVNEM